MTFHKSSVDWFLGKQSSHMGAEQYVAHAGMRDGQPTSGAFLWEQAEIKRLSSTGNMVNAETQLLHKVADEIDQFVPSGIDVVELGPGTVNAFKNKTLPLIRKLKSSNCILVDESVMFLKQLTTATDLGKKLKIKPVIDNFFENDYPYIADQALVCSFGSTITNIINPVSSNLPAACLASSLSALACAANQGWLLVGFDSDQNGERIKNYFKQHSLFQLNIFDRMAVELPIEGNFDPKNFTYDPEWIASSGQLAHVATVSHDMDFILGGIKISLKKGQKLHIKNSYKFTTRFFEECCVAAGLEVIKAWEDESPAKLYLLKIMPKEEKIAVEHRKFA